MPFDYIALIIIWVVTLTWPAFAILAAIDSWLEYRDVRRVYKLALSSFSNGRLTLARCRRKGGLWYVIAFNGMAVIGILVTIRFVLNPPSLGEVSLFTTLLRLLVLLTVFAFWRTMRIQRQIRRS